MNKTKRIPIGLRTIKTALAVVISMALVYQYGATSSKLIFAMLGAMAAMEPTFKDSIQSCLTQIVGMMFGLLIGGVFIELSLHPLLSAGLGIIIVITLYNIFHIRFSPSLPCLIVVILCTTDNIQPLTYAITRLWDTAIGLGVGLVVNTIIFPYDNISQIRATAKMLDQELILFLEDMFDGDNHIPDTDKLSQMIDDMNRQLSIFSKQWQLMKLKNHRQEYYSLQTYQQKARSLVAHMEVLSSLKPIGRISKENRQWLLQYGAKINDKRDIDELNENDIITNYHIDALLSLRSELLEILNHNALKK